MIRIFIPLRFERPTVRQLGDRGKVDHRGGTRGRIVFFDSAMSSGCMTAPSSGPPVEPEGDGAETADAGGPQPLSEPLPQPRAVGALHGEDDVGVGSTSSTEHSSSASGARPAEAVSTPGHAANTCSAVGKRRRLRAQRERRLKVLKKECRRLTEIYQPQDQSCVLALLELEPIPEST